MFKKVTFLLISTLLLAGCSLPGFVQKKAGLEVNVANNEGVEIFLDAMDLGRAPYKADNLKPGTYTLKLVPTDKTKSPHEAKVTLGSGGFTVVSWTFGAKQEESGGEIFELSQLSNSKKTELSLATSPDNVVIKLDGQSKGFSPLVLEDISEGSHTLTLTAPGYVERTSSPNIRKGYRVTVTSTLGREPETVTPSPTPTPSPTVAPTPTATPKALPKPSPKPSPSLLPTPATSSASVKTSTTPPLPYVEVKETGTSFGLHVRASASSSSEVLADLPVGSKVPYLNETVSGWHKIEYETGKTGWVSGQYAVVHSQ